MSDLLTRLAPPGVPPGFYAVTLFALNKCVTYFVLPRWPYFANNLLLLIAIRST